ncbi:MAG: sn-glycerol-3-phosphate ABC transporter ATP-binding protein UgpC [Neisseriaceae bacterium]|nr:MAG: sn-glycerol-3-phosphate ABC transporter ATP-binding protein UgpC [Neisseriaceae bacterium]
MASLELINVQKKYPDGYEAMRNFNVKIEDGEFVVIVGPSGCGKSTLMRMIAGLEEVTEGEVRICGRVVNQLEPSERDISMVFQNYALYPHMTVFQNISYGLKIAKIPKAEIKQRVYDVATMLGLQDLLDRKPKQLSGGQRQRVAMGRAIVRDPKIFLFDEPLSNLDAKLRVQMRLEIKKLQRQLKVTSLYVTHDQVEAMTLADRIIVLNKGNIEQIGTPDEIFNDPASYFVADFMGSPPMNLFPVTVSTSGELIGFDYKIQLNRENRKKDILGKEVYLGIRPEHLVVDGSGLPMEIEMIESLGSEKLFHLVSNNNNARYVMSHPIKHMNHHHEVGERIKFWVDNDINLRWFSRETGKRIY